jgi:hypothetical protein
VKLPTPSRSAVAASAAAAVGLLFFGSVLTGGVLWYGDFNAAFEPLRGSLGRAWRSGLPLWNPDLANGTPFLASPFAAALYPPNLLFAAPGVEPARLLSWLTVAHAFWALLGTFRLARRLGISPPGAAAAAVVYPLSGALAIATYTSLYHSTFCWLPWFLLAAVALREAPPGRAGRPVLGGLAVLASMIVSGEPFAVAAALLGGAFVLGAPGPAGAGIGRRAGRAAVVFSGGLFLAAPLLLAAFLYLPSTVRAGGLPVTVSGSPSLQPLELLGTVLADPFGDEFRRFRDASLAGFLQRPNVALFGALFGGLYVGSGAIALALLGAATRRRHRLAFLLWALALLLLALGPHGPLAPLFSLPGLNAFRFPIKWITAAFLPLALLVGDGVDALAADTEAPPLRRPSVLAAISVIGLLAAVTVGAPLGLDELVAGLARPGADAARLVPAIRSRLVESAGVSALFGAALLVIAATRGRQRGAAAAALMAADLLVFNRALIPFAPLAAYEALPAAVGILRRDGPDVDRTWVDHRSSTRAIPTRARPDEPLGETALRLRRQRLDGYSGLSYGLRLAFPLDIEGFSTRRYEILRLIVQDAPPRLKAMLLGASGVSHVVTLSDLSDERLTEVGRADVSADAPIRVLRDRLALPRARVVTALAPWGSPEEIARRLSAAPDDFFIRTAFVDAADLPALVASAPAPGAGAPGPVTYVRDEASAVILRARGPGWLVLSDTYAPGWSAEVDGRPERIFPADVAFRLVPLSRGEHEVAFRYDPWRGSAPRGN